MLDMEKIVRLSESDLQRITKKVLKENMYHGENAEIDCQRKGGGILKLAVSHLFSTTFSLNAIFKL